MGVLQQLDHVRGHSKPIWIGGRALVGNGSGSGPSLTFVNEQNMGFYRADTSDLRFASLGADRLRVATNVVELLQNAHIAGTITNDALSANTAVISGSNKQLTSSSVT